MKDCVSAPVVVAADAAAVVALRPDAQLLGRVAAPHAWVADVGVDRAAAQLASATLWCAAVWVAIGVLSATAGALPGAVGRAADALARVLLPRMLYRVIAGATGVGLVLSPMVAGAATSPSARPSSAVPAWPTDNTLPAPTWPSVAPHVAKPAPRPHRATGPASSESVTVRPGDTLWSIAAAHTDRRASARVARTWPRWYAANRAVIGADPNHIVPGQVLHTPTEHRPGGTP
jgi:nucleoid-associated protein YgaU